MKQENILLIGGGGHCKSAIDVIEQEGRFKIGGIFDHTKEVGERVLNYKIIGSCSDENLLKIAKSYKYALITVGQIKSAKPRVRLYNLLKNEGLQFPTIISPLAYVSKYAKIEEGTIIMHHVLINSNTKIGKNCIINTKALIEHDTVIEDHCHISTAAVLNGGVRVKSETFFGSNATAKEQIVVKGFVKAGSLVK